MRTPRPEWVAALRSLVGSGADLRFNESVGRWEFLLPEADGKCRSQFWGHFDKPKDPVTGMPPFRDLNDGEMRIALRNLEKTFIGNPFDGAGTTRREVAQRIGYNKDRFTEGQRVRSVDFADYVHQERRRILHNPQIAAGIDLRRTGT